MSSGTIFWATWGRVMHTCEGPDFGGLHKSKNYAFPLKPFRS